MAFRSHLGRQFDLTLGSNRLAINIAAGAGVAGIIFGFIRIGGWTDAAITGLVWAGASLLAWITARELNHDDPRPATFAAVLAPLGAGLVGVPGFLVGAAVLLAARVALNSTGRIPLLVDLVGVTGLGLWISRSPEGWVVALVLAVALARAAVRHERMIGGRWWGLGLSAGSTVVLLASGGFAMAPVDTAAPLAVVIGAFLGFGIASRVAPEVETDRGGPPPSGSDQAVARLLTLVAVITATLISGDAGIVFPAAAALISLSVRKG